MSKLLWFLIGSAVTLVVGAVASHIMEVKEATEENIEMDETLSDLPTERSASEAG